MKRYVTFGVIGPFVGFLVFIALGGGFKSHFVEAFLIVLPFAMIAGVVPAIVTAAFDGVFERQRVRRLERYVLAGLVGYGAAYLLMLENLFESTPLISFQYYWGLIGAIPAVFCSWLTSVWAKSSPSGE